LRIINFDLFVGEAALRVSTIELNMFEKDSSVSGNMNSEVNRLTDEASLARVYPFGRQGRYNAVGIGRGRVEGTSGGRTGGS
jgi:hypothetical protein